MPDSNACACVSCRTEVAPGLLTCPGCHRLVHAERLKDLAAKADHARGAGDVRSALVAWREALELLPQGSRQYDVVSERISELGRAVDQAPAPAAPTEEAAAFAPDDHAGGWHRKAGWAGLGTAGLFLWKFKFAAIFLVTKAKFLLLGLTKASTFLSMLASVGVYWAAFGWWFALGLVASIYVHEMGHVYALNRYGVKASAPMFIPGFGAVIRLKQNLTDPRQDARVGLAGPVWGLGTALAFFGAALAFRSPAMAAIAQFGAVINLFNLIPIWQLDGGRAWRTLGRSQRWLATAAIALAWSLTEHPFLVFLILGALFRNLSERAPAEPDRAALVEYVGLVGALSAMTMIPVDMAM
jgi:Zn-dependent protease